MLACRPGPGDSQSADRMNMIVAAAGSALILQELLQ